MPKIVITKRVSLDFLGEKYADSFIELRSITMRERPELIDKLTKLDAKASDKFVQDLVIERFVAGNVAGTELTADDLLDLPSDVFLEAVAQLQGRTDPKS